METIYLWKMLPEAGASDAFPPAYLPRTGCPTRSFSRVGRDDCGIGKIFPMWSSAFGLIYQDSPRDQSQETS